MLEAWEFWTYMSVFYVLWTSTAGSGLLTMGIDPADPSLLSSCQTEGGFYCWHCQIEVRSRSKHCRECKKCVDIFDHHCVWLNTCVGGRNYRAFFATILSMLLMLGVLVVSASMLLAREFHGARRPYVATALLATLGLNVPLWLVDAIFLGLHCLLCARGLTTYELMRGMHKAPSSRRSGKEDNIQGGSRNMRIKTVPPVKMAQLHIAKLPNLAAAHCSDLPDEESSSAPDLEDDARSTQLGSPRSPLTSPRYFGRPSRVVGWLLKMAPSPSRERLLKVVPSPSRERTAMKGLNRASSWVPSRPLSPPPRLCPQHAWSPLVPVSEPQQDSPIS